MFQSFRPEQFRPRRSLKKQWVIYLQDDCHSDPKIALKDYRAFNPADAGSNIVEDILWPIRARMIRPYAFDILFSYLDDSENNRVFDCAMITGSECGESINTLATGLAPWGRILNNDGSTWPGCFAITGPVVLLRKRKDGSLTTFSRREALELAAWLLPDISSS